MSKEEMIDRFIDEIHDAGLRCVILIEDDIECVTHICNDINDLAMFSLTSHKQLQDIERARKQALN